MPASGGRSSEAGKSPPAGLWLVEGAGLGPRVCVVIGVVSHAPIRHLPAVAGAMTVPSEGRAAQSGHRARQCQAHAETRARPGHGDPSRSVAGPGLAARAVVVACGAVIPASVSR